MTSAKFTLVKVGFSIKDPIHQGPEWSTLRQIAHPRGFAPPAKAIYGHTNLYSMIGHDSSSQRALYPRLAAAVHRLAWAVG
jgi:hypothetical protein